VPIRARPVASPLCGGTVGCVPRIPRRDALPDGLAHVISRGNRRGDLFQVERDYRIYLELLAEALKRFGVKCHGWTLMPNHVHLLLEAPAEAISDALQRANGRYAQWFNHRHGYVGHVFQGRFTGIPVESQSHLLELARYIANNPVRAGLCNTAAEWPWSSFTVALADPPPLRHDPRLVHTRWLLRQFGRDAATARRRLAAFVADNVWNPPPRRNPLPVG
jgi:REP element-mobilizing transposase RayT